MTEMTSAQWAKKYNSYGQIQKLASFYKLFPKILFKFLISQNSTSGLGKKLQVLLPVMRNGKNIF